MISAQELRIGNWVNYQTEEGLMLCQIDAEDIYNIARKHMASDELHSPIPLTPEILEKAGAKRHKDGIHWVLTIGASVKMKFRFYPPRVYSELGDIYLGDHIEHLHILQNIVASLTGEELTLNP